ncbi:MAG: GDSL family lipase [Planctomycetes bacterium]|nr:GDSL family lipase [Planctomycetota bacterium]
MLTRIASLLLGLNVLFIANGICLAEPSAVLETPVAPAPATVRPVPRNDEWWQNRHAAMNNRVAQGNVDLLMIGDSITQGWEGGGKEVWAEFYGKRNAVNLGISGDRTEHVLWRLQNGNIKDISPKAAVIMIGTNNAGSNTSEEIALGVEAIVKLLRKELPETKLLVLAIFPRGETSANKHRLVNEGANERIEQLADGKMIHFLDIGQAFLKEDGTLPKEVMPDFLHPRKHGYSIWARAMEPKLAELLK